MKCTACGENNMPNARFCAFCGVRLAVESTPSAPVVSDEEMAESESGDSTISFPSFVNSRATARPLNNNPYQPPRAASSRASDEPTFDKSSFKEAPLDADAPHFDEPEEQSAEPKAERSTPFSLFGRRNTPKPAPVYEEETFSPDESEKDDAPFEESTVGASAPEPKAERPSRKDRAPLHEADERDQEPTETSAEATKIFRRSVSLSAQSVSESSDAETAEKSSRSGTRVQIKASPNRVFVFDDENEEDIIPRSRKNAAKFAARYEDEDEYDDDDYVDEYDGIREFDENNEFEEEEEDYYEEEEEEEETSGGKVFVRVFSILTVLLLIGILVAFLFGTSIGRRLRTSMGWSSSADDYLMLADWQLSQHNYSDASASYYNAFKLDQDNYELALIVGTGFENAGDDKRAEQLYSYLITIFPQQDEPYDRLMALLNRQGRTADYQALLELRSRQQPGYVPSVSKLGAILKTPVPSNPAGTYLLPFSLTLDAGGAEIRYTIDGSTPSAQSLLYTGAITLPAGTYNIRAVSVVNGVLSGEWSGTYILGQ